MKIRRTACAGVLLELDGIRLLLDGVGREVKPYQATPLELRQELIVQPPDALLTTHIHDDHYEEAYVSWYYENTAGPILGPSSILFARQGTVEIGDVTVIPIRSRHIGREPFLEHLSYIIKGSYCIWFLGDSSPLFWNKRNDLPRPDVLIAPYAYGMGMGWEICKSLAPQMVVLLHLPERDVDTYGLWEAVESTAGKGGRPPVYIPRMGNDICVSTLEEA